MSNTNLLYNQLKDVFFLLDDGDRRLLERYGLTIPRFYALYHIFEQPGISPGRLSDLMLCDKSNITRLIKGLENDHLVERIPHEHDGRTQRLYLTPAGQSLCQESQIAHQQFNHKRFNDCLSELEQTTLSDCLDTLRVRLQQQLTNFQSYLS